jgi:PAS domain S-box-containing protein
MMDSRSVLAPTSVSSTTSLCHHRQILDALQGPIFAVNAQGAVTTWNYAAQLAYGWSAEEVIGHHMVTLLVAESTRSEALRMLERSSCGNRSVAQLSIQCRDGSQKKGAITASPLYDDGQAIVGAVFEVLSAGGSSGDEDDLINDTEHYRLVTEHTRDLIALFDQDGHYVYASPSHLHILGYEPTTLRGSAIFSLVHPVDLAVLLEQWPRLIAEGALQTTLRLRHAGGAWCWFDAVFHIAVRQGSQHLVCVANDITASRQTEKVLARLLRHNELILTSVGEGICGVDLAGNITFANPAAARMLGWDVGDLIGRPLRDLVQPTPAAGMSQSYEMSVVDPTLRDGTTRRGTDEVFSRKDGGTFPVEYLCAPIRQGGTLVGAVVTFQDSTARKQLEAQLLQAQKMEGIGRLAGGIAHDFNNLLTGIIGYTELAMRALPPDSGTCSDLAEVEKAAQRAAELVRQLLAFARKQIMEPRLLNLNDVIRDVERLLRRLIGEDINLITRTATDPLQIKADPGQIEQVIVNLAVNARDAMPNGGKLIIQTSHSVLTSADVLERFADLAAGPYVVLDLIDTGVGIPPELAAQIFEPFFTTKEQGKGTGLGLATCYGIVKQHNGTIQVASVVGQGTTFRIYLPHIQTPSQGATTTGDIDQALPRGTETILVVEDEPSVRALMVFVLREQGYTVLEAPSGVEALVLMQAHANGALHLLLTDMVMPQISGSVLAEQLKAQRPRLKVIITSGYADNPSVTRERLGPDRAFLQKPFSAVELARSVRNVLDA